MRVLTRPTARAAIVLAAVLAATAALAAEDGIDCAKAEQPDEKAICADAALVRDDTRMASLFKAAMGRSGMGERGDLQDGQTAWLDERRACKADATCLRAAYAARIERLRSVIDAAAKVDDPF